MRSPTYADTTASDDASSASETPQSAPVNRSDGDGAPLPPGATKKRKTTYYHRRDEIKSLKDEIQTLQEALVAATREAIVGRPVDPRERVDDTARSTFFATNIARNNLKIAGTQAMLSAYNMTIGRTPSTIPLKSFVHLPVDPDKRLEIMKTMQREKLPATYQFMAERTRGLDLGVPQTQHEQFNFVNGEIRFNAFEVDHFDTGHSLRQVFDAFMYYIVNQEICMSTELGLLTIRESEEVADSMFCQTRFLSSIPEGLDVESNAVMFAACVDGTPSKPAYAVGHLVFVDQDDLHPYRPDRCGRRDMTATVQFTELPSPGGEGPPVVVISRWAHVHFRPPTFPLSKEVELAMRERIAQNDTITFKVMRERLATIEPAGVASCS